MAKKRYYQSKKDRLDESRGMKEYYAGKDERRRMEYEDSMMIREDRNAVANLPQDVIMKEYPRADYGDGFRLNDTIRGVDAQMAEDKSGERKNHKSGRFPEKY